MEKLNRWITVYLNCLVPGFSVKSQWKKFNRVKDTHVQNITTCGDVSLRQKSHHRGTYLAVTLTLFPR